MGSMVSSAFAAINPWRERNSVPVQDSSSTSRRRTEPPDRQDDRIPKGLSVEEQDVYVFLLRVLNARKTDGTKPPHLAVISDLAKDYDDLGAMVVLKEAHRLGLGLEEGQMLTLVCLSSLSDAWNFASKHPKLFKDSVEKIVCQGGYFVKEGELHPDPLAANNRFDMKASEQFHSFIYKERIPSLVFTKYAAYVSFLSTQLFADLAHTKHPVGEYLRMVQVKQDVEFYKNACSPNKEDRMQPDMDQQRYLRDRTNYFDVHHGPGEKLPDGDEVIQFCKVIMYDALAALGACGEDVLKDLEVLDHPATVFDEPQHQIVGHSREQVDVNGRRMALVIQSLLKGSLLAYQQGLR
ncbi:hypothetical protein M8818_005565 [Zalaria obscura]|uniref:Uncharacterized protein n=1 Tax=Zalaria obscura TaxID=2024903 RepID=A0ACC3SA67_9PEZI